MNLQEFADTITGVAHSRLDCQIMDERYVRLANQPVATPSDIAHLLRNVQHLSATRLQLRWRYDLHGVVHLACRLGRGTVITNHFVSMKHPSAWVYDTRHRWVGRVDHSYLQLFASSLSRADIVLTGRTL